MEIEFRLFFERIHKGDKEALRQLIIASSIIIRNWARKEKHELRWIAGAGKISDYNNIVTTVVRKFVREKLDSDQFRLTTEQYKNFLVEEFGNEQKKGFSEFISLLKKKDQKAWKIVFNDLEKRAAAWFYGRGGSYRDGYHSLFCESIELVYVKFMNNYLVFNDSAAFKSYFFKTLENKFFESVKNPEINRSVSLETAGHNDLFSEEGGEQVEQKETQELILKSLDRLTLNEQFILNEYFFGEKKLREIASETGQSEENVRIKKFRALKKLFNHLKLMGYES